MPHSSSKTVALNLLVFISLQVRVRNLHVWDTSAIRFENAEQEDRSKWLHSNAEAVPSVHHHPDGSVVLSELRKRGGPEAG